MESKTKGIEINSGTDATSDTIPAPDNPTREEPMYPLGEKRHRRPKGVPEGVTVETIRNAYIDLFTPERPEGFNKVFIRLWEPGELADVRETIEWPERMTAIDAIEAHFLAEATGGQR